MDKPVASSSTSTPPAVFVLEPPRHGGWQARVLPVGKYILGSATDCQIHLPIDGVLPHHALLIVSERKTLIKAYDDRTWINDWPVKESIVKPGDRLSFGPVTFRWRWAKPEELLDHLLAPEPPTPAAPHPAFRPSHAFPLPVESETESIHQAEIDSEKTVPRAPSLPILPAEIGEELASPVTEIDGNEPVPDANRIAFLEQRLEQLTARERVQDETLIHSGSLPVADAQTLYDVEAESTRLQVWQSGLSTLQTQLAERELSLQSASEQLAQQTEAFQQQLTQLDLDLQAHEADLTATRRQFEANLAQQQGELNAERQQLAAERQQLTLQFQELEAQQAQFAELRQEFDQQRLHWETDRCACQDRLEAEKSALELERSSWEYEQEAALASRDETARRSAELAEQLTDLARREQELAQQQDELDHRQADLSEAQSALAADRQQRHALQEDWSVRESELTAEIARLTAAVSQLHDQQAVPPDDAAQAAWQQQLEAEQIRLQVWAEELETQRQHLAAQEAKLAQRWSEDSAEEESGVDERAFLEAEQARLQGLKDDIAQREELLAVAQADFQRQQTDWIETQRTQTETLDHERTQCLLEHSRLAEWEQRLVEQEHAWQQRCEDQAPLVPAALMVDPVIDADSSSAASPAETAAVHAEIERLTEHLHTTEMQIDGLQQRHSQVQSQWQEERVEWMLQRDRLEKNLAEANQTIQQLTARQAAVSNTPPLPVIDLTPIEDEEPVDSALDEVTADSSYETPDESFGEIPFSRVAQEAADESAASVAEPVSSLRAELARMFDLPGISPCSSSNDNPDTDVAEVEPEAESARDESTANAELVEESGLAASLSDDWRSKLDSLMSAAEPEPAPVVAASPEPLPEEEAAAEEEDSISAYMERLLARNRREGSAPAPEPVKAPPRTAPRAEAPGSSSVAAPGPVSPSVSTDAPTETKEDRRAARPRVASNKEEDREHLQVLRQVANVSARSAVAKHTAKTLRMAIIVKAVVALVSVFAGIGFLYGWLILEQAYLPQAMGCLIMGIFVGADLLRNLLHVRHSAQRVEAALGETTALMTPVADSADESASLVTASVESSAEGGLQVSVTEAD